MRLRVGGSGCPGAGGNERASLFHCLGLDRRALSLRIRGRRFESYRSAMFRAVQNNTWDLARTPDLHSRGAMSPTLSPGACNGSPTCPHRACDCGFGRGRQATGSIRRLTEHHGDDTHSLRLCGGRCWMYRDRPLRQPIALRSDAQQFSFEVRVAGLWILRCGGPVVRAGPPPQVGSPLASRISTLSDGDV